MFQLSCANILIYTCCLKCISIRTLKTINFSFVLNGKLMVLGVPLFKHIRISMTTLLPSGRKSSDCWRGARRTSGTAYKRRKPFFPFAALIFY